MAAEHRLRVVLAEDDLLVREGLRAILAEHEAVEVVGVCGDLDDLLHRVDAVHPDVVLTDIRMPPSSSDEGIRAAQVLRATAPDVGVVVLSQFLEPALALALFADGARRRGYLLKSRVAEPERLVEALRIVGSGGSFIDDDVVDALFAARRAEPVSPLAALTPREGEVLELVATGRSNAAVAALLGVSERAVEKHINTIFAKLGLPVDGRLNRRVAAVLVYLTGARHPVG